MSHRNPKKTGLFDFHQIDARIRAKNEHIRGLREKLNAVKLPKAVNLGVIMEKRIALTEDEALQLLAGKMTVSAVCNLGKAVQHVPENIRRWVFFALNSYRENF